MAKKTYKVKKGDNYFKIAERLWGNQAFAGQLIRANPGINKLFAGIVLKLPKVDVNDPHPFFGQAAWERAQGMEADREQQQRTQNKQRRREERLAEKLGLGLPRYEPEEIIRRSGPGYEEDPAYARPRGAQRGPGMRREDIPDWYWELPDEDFGPFTREEVWDAAKETAELIKELGLVPGFGEEAQPKTPREIVKLEGAEVLDAPGEVGQLLPEVEESLASSGSKVQQQPVKQEGTPEPPPTVEQAEALRILDIGFGAELSDVVMLGNQGDDQKLTEIWNAYLNNKEQILTGQMSLSDVKEKVYGTRDIEIEPQPTPKPEPTQTPTPEPIVVNFRETYEDTIEIADLFPIEEETLIAETINTFADYFGSPELFNDFVELEDVTRRSNAGEDQSGWVSVMQIGSTINLSPNLLTGIRGLDCCHESLNLIDDETHWPQEIGDLLEQYADTKQEVTFKVVFGHEIAHRLIEKHPRILAAFTAQGYGDEENMITQRSSHLEDEGERMKQIFSDAMSAYLFFPEITSDYDNFFKNVLPGMYIPTSTPEPTPSSTPTP